jgi:CcmD family protein
MKNIKSIYCIIIALLLSNLLQAQSGTDAGLMRSNGKIFVVMSVVVIIMVGLFIYLFSIDRKISRLEKEVKHK